MNAKLYALGSAVGATILLAACATLPEPQAKAPDVVGTWRLVSVETILPNGQISTAWMGKAPTGLLMYQPNGLMAVQIMRDPKPTFSVGSRRQATPEELKSAYFGYYAYWGKYTVSARERTVTHHVTASLWPEEVGITSKRFYALDGQRLVLTTRPIKHEGGYQTNRLTWERVGE